MITPVILTTLAIVFFTLALFRIARSAAQIDPAARTWLLIAIIFSAVSAWLWFGNKSS
jgi:hypothetical protein